MHQKWPRLSDDKLYDIKAYDTIVIAGNGELAVARVDRVASGNIYTRTGWGVEYVFARMDGRLEYTTDAENRFQYIADVPLNEARQHEATWFSDGWRWT